MSGVSKCRVIWVGGREGGLVATSRGIRASQGTFSSFIQSDIVLIKSNHQGLQRNLVD